MNTAMSGVSLFKSQEDFYRRNKATMKTARELTNEAERGSVDLRYAYKLLPPGSKNFYATAWEQTWGDGALMYRAKMVDSKRPVIEKINLDQPETGSLPTSAPKNGLGSEGLICDTLVGDSADYMRVSKLGSLLRSNNASGLGDDDGTVSDRSEGSVAEGNEGEEAEAEEGAAAARIALADGQYAHGEAAWGPAPGDNERAYSYAPSAAGDTPSVRSRVSRRSYGGSVAGSSAEPESTPSYRSAASRDSRYTDFFSATTRTYRSPPPSVGGASAKTGGAASSKGRRTPVSARSMGGLSKDDSTSSQSSGARSGGGGGRIRAPSIKLVSGKTDDPSGGMTPAQRAAAVAARATNIPKASAYPAANALAKKVRAAKGAPSEGIAAERLSMSPKERARFDKWVQSMGYTV
jgi:hypothetical protein